MPWITTLHKCAMITLVAIAISVLAIGAIGELFSLWLLVIDRQFARAACFGLLIGSALLVFALFYSSSIQNGNGFSIAASLRFVFAALAQCVKNGLFYFFAGLCFITAAYWSADTSKNSTLTFMLALLGIAVLLYGTGSQAVLSMGQGRSSLDPTKAEALLKDLLKEPDKANEVVSSLAAEMKPIPTGAYANFAVAGGAAALTAFFGWGITERRSEIRDVFVDHTRYDLVQASLQPSSLNLDYFRVSATLPDGEHLYARSSKNMLFISVPEGISRRAPNVTFTFERIDRLSTSAQNIDWQRGTNVAAAQFSSTLQMKENSYCAISKDYGAEKDVNNSGSLEAPIRVWSCALGVQSDADTSAPVLINNIITDENNKIISKSVTVESLH